MRHVRDVVEGVVDWRKVPIVDSQSLLLEIKDQNVAKRVYAASLSSIGWKSFSNSQESIAL